MKTRILDKALNELEDAVDYYNHECPGLGYEFADEIFRTIARASNNSAAWQKISARTRRCIAHRFPYGVLYQLGKEELLIISIMHLHRHPDSWKK